MLRRITERTARLRSRRRSKRRKLLGFYTLKRREIMRQENIRCTQTVLRQATLRQNNILLFGVNMSWISKKDTRLHHCLKTEIQSENEHREERARLTAWKLHLWSVGSVAAQRCLKKTTLFRECVPSEGMFPSTMKPLLNSKCRQFTIHREAFLHMVTILHLTPEEKTTKKTDEILTVLTASSVVDPKTEAKVHLQE